MERSTRAGGNQGHERTGEPIASAFALTLGEVDAPKFALRFQAFYPGTQFVRSEFFNPNDPEVCFQAATLQGDNSTGLQLASETSQLRAVIGDIDGVNQMSGFIERNLYT